MPSNPSQSSAPQPAVVTQQPTPDIPTAKLLSSSSRPRDGAKTLVDAVTAYQRRNARPRADRSAPQPSSPPTSNPQATSSPHSRSPRRPPPHFDSARDQLNPPPSDRSRPSRNRHHHDPAFKRGPNPSKEVKSVKASEGRGAPKNGQTAALGSSTTARPSKLYDPNASTQPQTRLQPERRLPSSTLLPPSSRRTEVRNESAGIIPANCGQRAGEEAEGPRLAMAPNHSTAAMDADITGHERWKSKKPIRGENPNGNGGQGRQLFDPRKHDPVKFSAVKRPPEGSMEAPETSKLTNGLVSNAYLTSDGFESQERGKGVSTVVQLKRAYKHIVSLETALKEEEYAAKAQDEQAKTRGAREGITPLHPKLNGHHHKRGEDDYWVKLAKQHRDLAEAHHHFMQMASDPHLPVSMQGLPQKYNLPTRLWQTGFHQLLERLRHGLPSRPQLLEHMTDFIYFAYGFYINLLEEQSLGSLKSVWIEQLGDLARYRMAVAGLISKLSATSHPQPSLPDPTSDTDSEPVARVRRRRHGSQSDESLDISQDSRTSASASPPPKLMPKKLMCGSIGVAALGDWECEEQEIWRATAKDWYSKGLAESPRTGRLHHHLALLSKGDELRTLYHYAKSLTAAHPYLPARESILPFFESEHQARRTRPEVSIHDLFVHLHRMLFTKIQLDDFDTELARFMEKLTEDRLLADRHQQPSMSDSSWAMMATINISALLQYGAEDGVVRLGQQMRPKTSSDAGPRGAGGKTMAKTLMIAPQAILVSHRPSQSISSEDGMLASSVDQHSDVLSTVESPVGDEASIKIKPGGQDLDTPIVFSLAAKLSFDILADALQSRTSRCSPYVSLMLTFLASMASHPTILCKLERHVGWEKLCELFNSIPDSIELRPVSGTGFKLMGQPLAEDWCLRGMEWTHKTVFARGYWKAPKHAISYPESEMDVLLSYSELERPDHTSVADQAHHLIDLEKERSGIENSAGNIHEARWRRISWVAVWISKLMSGFGFDPTMPRQARFVVLKSLRNKIQQWELESKREQEEMRVLKTKQRSKREKRMVEIDEEIDRRIEQEDEDDDENDAGDSELVRSLKARRRELRATLNQMKTATTAPALSASKLRSMPASSKPVAKAAQVPQLNALPGHTVLVLDTNILIGMLSIVKGLIDSERWMIIIPLVVITELDGLQKASGLGEGKLHLAEDATEAIAYLERMVKIKSRWLKIQTSRGNYLRDLSIRSEQIDFLTDGFSTDNARNLDDLVLRATMYQIEHASFSPSVLGHAEKVVLVTLDRNLRLKARARGIAAADEKQIISLFEQPPASFSLSPLPPPPTSKAVVG